MALPKPRGRQHEVLYHPDSGHLVVLGTAGSGKTTLAIHRAHYLAGVAPNAGKTLLVTFNRMLVTYLRSLGVDDLGNVDVRNYHRFAKGYLSSRGLLPPGIGNIAGTADRERIVAEAQIALARTAPKAKVLQASAEALAEEIRWIAGMGIADFTSYDASRLEKRPGLQVAKAERALMWRLRDEYLARRAAEGFLFDWDDLAAAVIAAMASDNTPRLYRHVVIDEGQDFSPEMLRSLVAAVPPDGSVTFFGDVAQQIYGSRRVSWRQAGLQIGTAHKRPIVHFKENYRNTKEIAAFAQSLVEGPDFQGASDLVVPATPTAAGVLPTVVTFPDQDTELRFHVNRASEMALTRRVAILLRTRQEIPRFEAELQAVGAEVRHLHRTTSTWHEAPCVWLGTFHASKGLEFEAVFLPRVDGSRLPDRDHLKTVGEEAAGRAEEASLLYVAITRARAELVLSHSSTLTSLLRHIPNVLYVRAKP